MELFRKQLRLAGTAVIGLAMTGCSTALPRNINQAVPLLAGPAPSPGVTKMEDALRCVALHLPRDRDLRLAVNDLTDGTGATMDGSALNKVLTQRPDVMMTIGLAKTGIRLVNRSSTGVAEWEIRQAMQKYIGDGRMYGDASGSATLPYRPVMAGAMLGSTHYVSGAITELNWNVYSTANEAGIGPLTAGKRQYRISVAVDLIVTDSRTTEIVLARSYSKQLVGTETALNMFRFFDVGTAGRNVGPNEAFQFNIGKEMNEPVQTAVRWILETAAYDIVTELSGAGSECDYLVPSESRRVSSQTTAVASRDGSSPTDATGSTGTSDKAALSLSPNALAGINLFADNGAVIARIDTEQPLITAPVLVEETADKLTFDFIGVRDGIDGIGKLRLASIRSVTLSEMPDRVRITLRLSGQQRFAVRQQGKSTLIAIIPAVTKSIEQPKLSEGSNPGSAQPLNDLNNAQPLLEPKRSELLKSEEQVIPIIQP